jgi:voltage-gated sodium channel
MKSIYKIAQEITNHKTFKVFILFLIFLSAVLTGIETYLDSAGRHRMILLFLDSFIVYCFAVEIFLKILALGKRPFGFFSDPWNVFDFIIVAVCLIPAIDTHFLAVIRIVRVLRILRMVNFFPKLRLLIGALLKSIPSMGYVIMLLALLFYIYSIIGVFIFGENDPMHFGDLHHAMVTLFKVLTLEGWTDIMNIQLYGNHANGQEEITSLWPFLYFASFILLGAMIIMNLFIGVIMNSMQESHNEIEQELQEIKFKGENSEELYSHIISRLDELRNEIQKLRKPEAKSP